MIRLNGRQMRQKLDKLLETNGGGSEKQPIVKNGEGKQKEKQ